MNKRVNKWTIIGILFASVMGQSKEAGVKREREVETTQFKAIEVAGPFMVEIIYGKERRVKVEGAKEFVKETTVEVEEEVLRIILNGDFERKSDVRVCVWTPILEGVSVSGDIKLRLEGIDVPRMRMRATGRIAMIANGDIREFKLRAIGGKSHFDMRAVSMDVAECELIGDNRVRLGNVRSVRQKVSGKSTIELGNTPERTEEPPGVTHEFLD